MSVGAILLVEDEALIRLDVETELQEGGFEVVSVANAEQALAAFDAQPTKFKGLVTDIRLGSGKSGWEIARHLRQATPNIPVVYMSGDSAVHWDAEGVPESIMINKPFFVQQIATALSTLLNAQPTANADDPMA
jgi:CheY-like chemotaxis protein